jgi:hypothetical protein
VSHAGKNSAEYVKNYLLTFANVFARYALSGKTMITFAKKDAIIAGIT